MLTAHQILHETKAASILVLDLAFAQREKSRFRATTRCGQEIGVSLKPGVILKNGDYLALSDGGVAQVAALPETLMQIHAPTPKALTAIAYHIGNRHVPLEVAEESLYLLPDHVLRAMIEGNGGQVTQVERPFQPESGAYGYGHVHHSHDDQGHGGRIHQGLQPRQRLSPDPR